MKSVKKSFKIALSEVERTANDLQLLATDVTLLAPLHEFAENVLHACRELRGRAKQLPKAGFAERMAGDGALLSLDEMVDCDVMSMVELGFSAAVGEMGEGRVVEMMRQLLDKLEKKLATLNENIQQLAGLLNAAN